MARVLAISDLHIPFQHPDAFDFLSFLKAKFKPTDIICLGDECDFHSISRWSKNPDGLSAGDETKAALKGMRELYAMFPRVKVCISNHTARPLKMAIEAGIPSHFIKSYKEFLHAPKEWLWAEAWEIDQIRYEHGESFSAASTASHAIQKNSQSTVVGHIHFTGGVSYTFNHKSAIFLAHSGCLIDPTSYAFQYASHNRKRPVLGSTVVIDGIPQFVPMILDRNNRWKKQTLKSL